MTTAAPRVLSFRTSMASGGSRASSGQRSSHSSGGLRKPDGNFEGASVQEIIRATLEANAARMTDLFRQWDTDGDGCVDRREFAAGLARLGVEGTKADFVRQPSLLRVVSLPMLLLGAMAQLIVCHDPLLESRACEFAGLSI